ncbi:MAG TPA: glycosyltransferase family 1 protein [Rhodopila sp.]|nr:glycosyltransferase family 1 protein [Rhodopila sp.]
MPRSRTNESTSWQRPFQHVQLREVGRTQGHLWEQTDLPGAASGGVLVNLGNTGPLLSGRRQIVVIHDASVFDAPYSYTPQFRIWYKALQRGLARTGARIVTVSEFSRNRISTALGLDPGRIEVIYEGADHICRIAPETATLKQHGLQPRRFVLVVGSLAPHKNIAQLRELALTLERRGLILAIVGGFDPNVFRDANTPNIAARKLGRVTDAALRALYENAACLLFPSRYEGFGLPPVEAMACDCPVIATAGGAVEEVCGDAAFYLKADHGPTATAAVERLLDDQGFADQLRLRGRERVAPLTWQASAQALGNVLKALLYSEPSRIPWTSYAVRYALRSASRGVP